MASTISVITASLPERADLLAEAMASVRAQTLQPVEHMVGVDFRREGPSAVRNRLAVNAAGDWLAFLDDDDVCYPRHLEVLLETASAAKAGLAWSACDVEGRPGWDVGHVCNYWDDLPHRNMIPVTVLVKRSAFAMVGGFPDVNPEDWALWRRLMGEGVKFACSHEVTWKYRFGGGNRSIV